MPLDRLYEKSANVKGSHRINKYSKRHLTTEQNTALRKLESFNLFYVRITKPNILNAQQQISSIWE